MKFRNIIIAMSLAGSSVVIFYIMLYPIIKRRLSLNFQKLILEIALVFYLAPVEGQKNRIIDAAGYLFPSLCELWNLDSIQIVDSSDVIYVNGGVVGISPELKLVYLITAIMLLVSLVIFGRQFEKYIRRRRLYRESSVGLLSGKWKEQFYIIKRQLGIRRDVEFLCSELCRSPETFGFVSPVVVFPVVRQADYNYMEYMIKHELLHVKHKDFLVRFFTMAAVAVHWFNPVVYFLYFELTAVSEMICDSRVISGLGDAGRKDYSNLILDYMSKGISRHFLAAGFADRLSTKRRILEMKKRRKISKGLAGIIVMLICMTGSLAMFAYNPAQIFKGQAVDFEEDAVFILGSSAEGLSEVIPCDYFFIDEAENMIPLSGKEAGKNRVCNHKKISEGQVKKHIHNGNGCCRVECYRAKICEICGYVVEKERRNTNIYQICIHDCSDTY